jgi:predicted P-loop ATPase
MLVLDGEQGIGKSHFAAWLASPLNRPELFVEGPINPEDKDDKVRLISVWIWEVSELGSTTRRSDREALKYFLSMQQVTVRAPYGRFDLVKPALSSFVGTVNNEAGFLDDPTGYRRFMSVHITDVDWAYAEEVDPAQLWAQAKALYDAGEPWELTQQEIECAQYANEQYEMDDPLPDLFMRFYEVTGDEADFVSALDIISVLNGHNWSLSSPRAEGMAISSMLKRVDGVKKTRRYNREHGTQERGYAGVKRKQRTT